MYCINIQFFIKRHDNLYVTFSNYRRMTQIRESKEAAQVLVVNHDDAISLSSDDEDVDTEEEDNVEISALEGGAVGGL